MKGRLLVSISNLNHRLDRVIASLRPKTLMISVIESSGLSYEIDGPKIIYFDGDLEGDEERAINKAILNGATELIIVGFTKAKSLQAQPEENEFD